MFAGAKDGIIFKIKVLNGVDIAPYSVLPAENEVLLSPNMEFTVSSGVQRQNGMDVIELVENRPNVKKFVH